MLRNQAYLDGTYLEYGVDRRGVAHVVEQLVHILLDDERLWPMRIIATAGRCVSALRGLGVPDSRIVLVPSVPLLGRIPRLHGLFVDWRYRLVSRSAALIVHPEMRTVLRTPDVRQIVLFHDLFFLGQGLGQLRPRFPVKRLYHAYLLRKLAVASRATNLVTNSDYTRQQLCRHLPHVAPDSITVLHVCSQLGVPSAELRSSPPDEDGRVEFIFVGGAAERRKNLTALLQNYRAVAGPLASHLHVVGSMDARAQRRLSRLVASCGLKDTVTLEGALSDDRLAALYSHSHFLLFPSLAEGFGLPLVEAMAHGVIPCAFRNSSIPEVLGNAGVIAETGDFASWGRAIACLTANPPAFRELQQAGYRRAEMFSAERVRQRYADYFAGMLQALRSDPSSL